MKKLDINKWESTYYFIWDDKNETIEMVNEYLKEVKGDNWKCDRCWDEDSKSNTSNVLGISKVYDDGYSESSSAFRIGEYVIDFGDRFAGYTQKDVDDNKHIECYKDYRSYKNN